MDVIFRESGDARMPWVARVGSEVWQVRVNEFPEEPTLYTLLVDGNPTLDFDDWPADWLRPHGTSPQSSPSAQNPIRDPILAGDFELEMAKDEYMRQHVGPAQTVEITKDHSAPLDPTDLNPKFSVDAHFQRVEKANQRDLARAMAHAKASGKESLDRERLSGMLRVGGELPDDKTLQSAYYILNPQIMTMEAFATLVDGYFLWNVW